MTTQQILEECRRAKSAIAKLTTTQKNRALLAVADSIEAGADEILAANALDMQAAAGQISEVMLDRLALNCADRKSVV